MGLLPPRPCALAHVPVERGRAGGRVRRPPDTVSRARVLERARPDPEGAHLRAYGPSGKPWRGRQGVLVVPRLDTHPFLDALALHVSAGGVPVPAPDRR